MLDRNPGDATRRRAQLLTVFERDCGAALGLAGVPAGWPLDNGRRQCGDPCLDRRMVVDQAAIELKRFRTLPADSQRADRFAFLIGRDGRQSEDDPPDLYAAQMETRACGGAIGDRHREKVCVAGCDLQRALRIIELSRTATVERHALDRGLSLRARGGAWRSRRQSPRPPGHSCATNWA